MAYGGQIMGIAGGDVEGQGSADVIGLVYAPGPPRDYPRYPYRTPTYRYYYDGGWYAAPWWLWFGPFSFGPGTPYYWGNWDAHVQWCLNRYRSYDLRSDTFLGYDGFRHRCRSPYRP